MPGVNQLSAGASAADGAAFAFSVLIRAVTVCLMSERTAGVAWPGS
jgi:hypothetical protein